MQYPASGYFRNIKRNIKKYELQCTKQTKET